MKLALDCQTRLCTVQVPLRKSLVETTNHNLVWLYDVIFSLHWPFVLVKPVSKNVLGFYVKKKKKKEKKCTGAC